MRRARKVCVVTGASSGIGRRTAADLARAGAVVCGVARRAALLAELIDELPGEDHSYVAADVSQRASAARVAAHVAERYGRLDVLVNNAGFSLPGPLRNEHALDDLEAVMATNFFGAAYLTHALLGLLEASAPSSVINVASVAGRLAVPGSSAYSASKFALVGWSEALQPELARAGVHVGLIEPGPVPTEGFPQSELVARSGLRFAVASTADVARAILAAIEHRTPERSVPRWYHLLQLPRVVAPPLYRWARDRILAGRAEAF